MLPQTVPLPLPGLDILRIARLHNALYGGTWADGPERADAEEIGRMYPGTRRRDTPGGAVAAQMAEARKLHARAATWAVTKEADPARGVVFAACGYPCDPDPHADALARAPLARFVFADLDAGIVLVNRARLAEPSGGRVTACRASARDPEGLLRHPAVLDIGGPVQLQVQFAAHWWPPRLARRLVAEYARLLPPRSTFLMSLGISGRADGGKLAAMLEDTAGVPVYGHGEDEIASWVTGAGMEFLSRPGVKAVRAHGRPWAAAVLGKPKPPGRIVYVSARKP